MPEQALNTEVVGDPESCRANATWLKTLAHGVGDLQAAFGRTGSQSETFWHGAASEGFRHSVANSKTNAQHVADAATKVARALSKFADDLDTVRSRMNQARQVASAAGLTVTDKEIQPPGAGPEAAQEPGGVDGTGTGEADHQAEVAAFNEVTGTIGAARGDERAAHEALQSAVKQQSEVLSTLKTIGQYALQKAVALTGGVVGASDDLLKSAEKSKGLGVLATALRSSPTLPAEANTALRDAQQELFSKWARDGAKRTDIEQVISKIPAPVRNTLKFNLSDVTKKAFQMDKGLPGTLKKDLPVLKRIPVVGTALTATFAARDIHDGKDPVKTTENAVGGTAASMGATAAVEGGIAAAEAAGLAVPGPGWVVAGGLAAGTAAALGVGWVVDNYGDQINHAVGSAASTTGHTIAGAAEDVGHFAGKIF